METGFAVTAFLSLLLNLIIPEEVDDEIVDVNAKDVDASSTERADRQDSVGKEVSVESSTDIERIGKGDK